MIIIILAAQVGFLITNPIQVILAEAFVVA
jgi:hypothetical protein